MTVDRKATIASVLAAAAALVSGCGSAAATRSGTVSSGTTTTHAVGATPAVAAPPAFAWLHPAPAPAAWRLARLAGTASLAYPPSWRRIHSDPGTASAAVVTPATGLIALYLNATPKQADETLQNWASFRAAHNADEGDSQDDVLAAARGLRFRNGSGSCVIDRYRTSRARYTEIACLVRAPTSETVIVAAGLTALWAQEAPVLERAVSAFLA